MATTGERALSILVARSGGSVEDGQKATGQGGILEGQDPSQYDPKNPVCPKRAHVVRREVLTGGTYRLFSSSSKHVSFSACAEHFTFRWAILKNRESLAKFSAVSSLDLQCLVAFLASRTRSSRRSRYLT